MGIIRKTKPVLTILNKFESSDNALSVVGLVDELKSQMNKTTVYRILDRLEGEGTLHSFTGKNGIKWYAKCKDCSKEKHIDLHPHFECVICGKIECIDVNISIPSIPNKQVLNSQILLQGNCELCGS
ncbi:MAG: Fur family transcriptional regulator [bacterium]